MYKYTVAYRRDLGRRKPERVVVEARNPDEARAKAAALDPLYLCPAGYPRRGAAVTTTQGA